MTRYPSTQPTAPKTIRDPRSTVARGPRRGVPLDPRSVQG